MSRGCGDKFWDRIISVRIAAKETEPLSKEKTRRTQAHSTKMGEKTY